MTSEIPPYAVSCEKGNKAIVVDGEIYVRVQPGKKNESWYSQLQEVIELE